MLVHQKKRLTKLSNVCTVTTASLCKICDLFHDNIEEVYILDSKTILLLHCRKINLRGSGLLDFTESVQVTLGAVLSLFLHKIITC